MRASDAYPHLAGQTDDRERRVPTPRGEIAAEPERGADALPHRGPGRNKDPRAVKPPIID